MPILLYCVGAICFAAGFAMAAYGIPVSEFSFGNTLIIAGSTVAVGGLVIFALGAIVSRLQQLIDSGSLNMQAPLPHLSEGAESAVSVRAAADRVPFPSRPKVETRPAPPVVASVEMPGSMEVPVAPPTLPNPDEAPQFVAEAEPLPPVLPVPEAVSLSEAKEELPPDEPKSAFDKEWPAPELPRERSFSFKWPERISVNADDDQEPPKADEAAAPEPEPSVEPPAVPERSRPAVLKSGIVDGMGYTLYVDGSIEAELPQGTLRFASINELREHLEQNN